MSELLIWLFCFVVDLIAWVCICGQFLHGLPVKLGMRVGLPIPICSIVHSTWLSLTCTASCRRDSHEPMLPLRKETFVTHRPGSHDQVAYRTNNNNKKNKFHWNIIITALYSAVRVPLLSPKESLESPHKKDTSAIFRKDDTFLFLYTCNPF